MRLPEPRRSRAVLIGTSTYRHLDNLPAVQNNLTGLRDVLTDPMLGGLPTERCTVVRDPAGVQQLYRTLRHAAAVEDVLLVYFAGHGRLGPRNELYLCLADTHPDELIVSAMRYDVVREVFAECPAANRVVILDCCFSGNAIPDMVGNAELISGETNIEGTYTLTATPRNAVALAPPGAQYTAFTGELLKLLRTGIPDGPRLLTFATIYPQLRSTMIGKRLPKPMQRGTETITDLALTRNPAVARPTTSRDSKPAPMKTAPATSGLSPVAEQIPLASRVPAESRKPTLPSRQLVVEQAPASQHKPHSAVEHNAPRARRTPVAGRHTVKPRLQTLADDDEHDDDEHIDQERRLPLWVQATVWTLLLLVPATCIAGLLLVR
jgi:hypothetical protein